MQSSSARSVTESPGIVRAGRHSELALRPEADVREEVDRLRHLDVVVAEARHRPLEVLLAGRMVPRDAEPLVARRVARGDQHVVDAGRVVGLEGEDRPPAVRDEVLAGPREQAVDVDARVLRAGVLADVGRNEREQVAALVALEVDDAEPPPAQQAHRAALPGRDHHPPLDFQRRLARHAAPPRVALPMRVGNQCSRRRATGGPGELGCGDVGGSSSAGRLARSRSRSTISSRTRRSGSRPAPARPRRRRPSAGSS